MGDRSGQVFAAARGVFFAALFISLWSWLSVSVRRFDEDLIPVPEWLRPAGWVLSLGGAFLAASCVAVFATRGRGTPAPFDPPRRFVADGPYRWVRNPMYVGAIGVMSGVAIAAGSPSILLLALLLGLLCHAFVVFYEEPALTRKFGDSYREYRARTGRWLPHRSRPGGSP